jgi:hypothetical protein
VAWLERGATPIVTIPLAPRTARAIDLAIGERTEGPLFITGDGRRLDRHGADRIVRRVTRRAGIAKQVGPLSRPGARFRCCHRPVSPDRSPNPPYRSLGNGLSTLPAVRRGSQVARGRGSGCPGRRNG